MVWAGTACGHAPQAEEEVKAHHTYTCTPLAAAPGVARARARGAPSLTCLLMFLMFFPAGGCRHQRS